MKIIKLEAENFKKLRAVSIEPRGNVTTIGGRNAQGKTSCLDAIAVALGGKSLSPAEPIRVGTDAARVVLELDDIVVKRTFTASGSQLIVTNKEGAKFPSPQAMLDRLVGDLSFDPLRFSRMDAKAQLATLRTLVGLDTSEADRSRKALFDERTEINRRVKQLDGSLKSLPRHDDAPQAEVSITSLAATLDERRKINQAKADKQRKLDQLRERAVELKAKIAEMQTLLADVTANGKAMAEEFASMQSADEAEIVEQMRTVESTNAKVRDNAAWTKAEQELVAESEKSAALTVTIDDLDRRKESAVAAAKFPVEGLGFGEDGVTFKGLPFAQASAAEQLRVSVAIGLAGNPRLRVLLIRDGSLLDEQSLVAIAEQAAKADAQLWIERVSSDGAGCTVVIEDGEVRVDAQKEGAA